MNTKKKSQINADTFHYEQQAVKVRTNRGWRVITTGRIDGKRVYFIEKRDSIGRLESSETHTSLKSLKAVL